MKGCLVMDAEIIDTKAYSKLVRKVPAAVAAHGGRILVRTSEIEAIQGDWVPKRFVLLEFASLNAVRDYIGSAEYAALDEVRRQATKANIVIVEGGDSQGSGWARLICR